MDSIRVIDFGSGISVNIINEKDYALNLYEQNIKYYKENELDSLIREIESYGIKVNPKIFEKQKKRNKLGGSI